MPEKTNQVQSSLAHCIGHCNFHRFLVYSIYYWPYSASLPACCKYFASRFIFSFSTTDFIVFVLYQKPSFVGLGNKCILQHGDLKILLPGYILDMSMIRYVPWCSCVSVSCSDL